MDNRVVQHQMDLVQNIDGRYETNLMMMMVQGRKEVRKEHRCTRVENSGEGVTQIFVWGSRLFRKMSRGFLYFLHLLNSY
jgi:hypothetical protein